MVQALLLCITIVSATVQNFFTKHYSNKTNKGVFLFNAMSALVALFIFVGSAGFQFTFVWGNFIYAVLFALSYFFAVFGLTMAIKTGPLSITALIEAYSMIIASIYGVIFLNEPMTVFMAIGLICLVISLTLINYEKKTETDKNAPTKKINGKWLFFVSIGFLGNGFSTVVQKMQQVWSEQTYGEGVFLYSDELMILGLFMAFLALMVCAFILERKDFKNTLRVGWLPALGRGVANGCANLFSILLMTMMAVSVANAIISVGCVVVAALISVIVFKEKLNKWQWIGIAIGVVSLILLNI